MPARISAHNGFKAMATLRRAALDPRIAEIEGAGMDEGRVFLHAKPGFRFGAGEGAQCSMSVGSAFDVRRALRLLEAK